MPNSTPNHPTHSTTKAAPKEPNALIWLSLSALTVLLDLVSKYAAEFWLSYNQPVSILPVLNMTLHYNTGAGFSFLADQGGWQRWFFVVLSVVVSLALINWLKNLQRKPYLQPMYVSLILGGALGNLYDRLFYGKVTDFISVHWQHYYFPTFNVADMAISLAAMLMIYDVLINQKHKQKP